MKKTPRGSVKTKIKISPSPSVAVDNDDNITPHIRPVRNRNKREFEQNDITETPYVPKTRDIHVSELGASNISFLHGPLHQSADDMTGKTFKETILTISPSKAKEEIKSTNSDISISTPIASVSQFSHGKDKASCSMSFGGNLPIKQSPSTTSINSTLNAYKTPTKMAASEPAPVHTGIVLTGW